jgi:hypothetical protein
MKHKKEIYEKMKRRDFGESMCDETKLKVLNFIERQLRLYNVVGQSEQLKAEGRKEATDEIKQWLIEMDYEGLAESL